MLPLLGPLGQLGQRHPLLRLADSLGPPLRCPGGSQASPRRPLQPGARAAGRPAPPADIGNFSTSASTDRCNVAFCFFWFTCSPAKTQHYKMALVCYHISNKSNRGNSIVMDTVVVLLESQGFPCQAYQCLCVLSLCRHPHTHPVQDVCCHMCSPARKGSGVQRRCKILPPDKLQSADMTCRRA